MLSELVGQLENVLQDRSPGYVERFEAVLAEIAKRKDPACIGMLLPFFNDGEQHYEMMYSIVHTIEMFDDDTYVREIANHLPSFWIKSPEWAITLHMRILNSPSTLAAYRAVLKKLSGEQREAAREVLNAVLRKNAQFESACNITLAAL